MAKGKAKVNSYEQVRKKRLEANLKRLQELGIMKISESLSEDVKSETKSVKRPTTPKSRMVPDMSQLRRSSRARNPAISYVDEVQVDIGARRVWRRGKSHPSHDIRMASYEERVQAQHIAEKLQMKLKSGKPSFVKSMVASHVSSCFWLGLPTAFCKSYLPEKEVTMILEDENGSEFDVIYIGRRVGLSGGWKGFARAHKLNDGDALVFELKEPTRFKAEMARLLRMASVKRLFATPESCGQGITGFGIQFYSFSSKGKRRSRSDGCVSSDDCLSKKDLALQQALDQITASFGKGAIMWLGRSISPRQVPVISSGSFALDLAMGTGGFPKGRVIEIYGPEASGKTTLALHAIAEAQKSGGYCAFVDAEHALDPALAEVIGVKSDNLLLSQPDSGELALSLVDTLIRSGSVDVIVVDSVSALVPKSELEGEMGDAHMALQGRLMSQALRKLSHSLSLSQTILIFINQVRSKLSTFGGFGGPTEVTSGGNALRFYACIRLNIKRIGLVKKGEETLGSQVLVKIVKNKLAPPFKTAQFEIEFGKGISRDSEVIELGLKHKFIAKGRGAMYTLNGQSFRGKDAIRHHFTENPEVREELMTKLREKLMHEDISQIQSEGETNNDLPEAIVSAETSDVEAAEA